MEEYLNEIPLIVRNAIRALCDESRQGILLFLKINGKKSFTEIYKELNISKNNLSHHIKILMKYGLIYNFFTENKFKNKYSFYELSKIGSAFLDILINFPIINKYTQETEDSAKDIPIKIEHILPSTYLDADNSSVNVAISSNSAETLSFTKPWKRKSIEINQIGEAYPNLR